MTESTGPSMISVDLNDAKEFTTLPGNTEHVLSIIRAELTPSKSRNGVFNAHLWLDAGDPTVDDIQIWIPVPNGQWKNDDEKTYNKAVNRFKDFATCFSFDATEIEVSRLVGLSGMCLVSSEEDDRNPGTFRNGVRDFVTGGAA